MQVVSARNAMRDLTALNSLPADEAWAFVGQWRKVQGVSRSGLDHVRRNDPPSDSRHAAGAEALPDDVDQPTIRRDHGRFDPEDLRVGQSQPVKQKMAQM